MSPSNSNSLPVENTALSEQHSQAADVDNTDSVPILVGQPENPACQQISDNAFSRLVHHREPELPETSTGDLTVFASQDDSSSDTWATVSVPDQTQPEDQQQQLAVAVIHEQPQCEHSDSRESQALEVNHVSVSRSVAEASQVATHDIEPEQLKLLINMLKQGQLVLPDQMGTVNPSSSFKVQPIATASPDQFSAANLSTIYKVKAVLTQLGTQMAAHLNSVAGTVHLYCTSPGVLWRYVVKDSAFDLSETSHTALS